MNPSHGHPRFNGDHRRDELDKDLARLIAVVSQLMARVEDMERRLSGLETEIRLAKAARYDKKIDGFIEGMPGVTPWP